MSGRFCERQAGFTLVEMLVVLAITSIVFTISAIGLSVLKGRATPERSSREIVALLNEARFDASNNGKPQSVFIDLMQKTVRRPQQAVPVTVPSEFELTVTIGREIVRNKDRLEIVFLPDGTSSGAEITIASPNGRSTRLQTNWLTGLTEEEVDNGT